MELILRLEEMVDKLLARNTALEAECKTLKSEVQVLSADRERVRIEVDRILAKIEAQDSQGEQP